MKTIKLTKGQHALVSDHQYLELSRYNWKAVWNKHTRSYYAVRTEYGRHGKSISMARQILNTPKGMIADHINRNTLDNQDHNLRNVSQAESLKNRGVQSRNRLQEKNIFIYKGKYRVEIQSNGIRFVRDIIELEEARRIRDQKLSEMHGEFAAL